MRLFFAVLLNLVVPPLGFLALKDYRKFLYFLFFQVFLSLLLHFLGWLFYKSLPIKTLLLITIVIQSLFYSLLLRLTTISHKKGIFERRNFSLRNRWIKTFLFIILYIIIYNVYDSYRPFLKAHTIPSASMEPSIRKGDWIYVDQTFNLNELSRGQLIVTEDIREDTGKAQRYIKRLIGLPGDTIEIKNKVFEIEKDKVNIALVSINGKPVEQKILSSPSREEHDIYQERIYSIEESIDGYKYEIFEFEREFKNSNGSVNLNVKLKENEYFVLGDNRDDSMDSRVIGPVLANRIKGIYAFTYFSINHNEYQCTEKNFSDGSCNDDLLIILGRKKIRWNRIGIRIN